MANPLRPPRTSTDPRHVVQRQQLSKFIDSCSIRIGHFKYMVWTTGARHAELDIHPSKLIPNTQGVHGRSELFVGPRTFITNYAGVLMWDELHVQFNKRAHCPTAVRVPVLDYIVGPTQAEQLGLSKRSKISETEWTVRIVLVGDPCALGPLLNSPRGTEATANCKLETCSRAALPRHLTTLSDGRIEVHADFCAIHRNGVPLIGEEVEFLLAYDDTEEGGRSEDGSAFWEPLESTEAAYCNICFGKLSSSDNPLILCSHNGCNAGRHRNCHPSMTLYDAAASHWYCSTHAAIRFPIRPSIRRGPSPPPPNSRFSAAASSSSPANVRSSTPLRPPLPPSQPPPPPSSTTSLAIHVGKSKPRHPFLDRLPLPVFAGLPALYTTGKHALKRELVEVRISCALSKRNIDQPVELELRSKCVFRKGEKVTYYGGIPASMKDIKQFGERMKLPFPGSHARRIGNIQDFALDGLAFAGMFNRPTPKDEVDLKRLDTKGAELLLPKLSQEITINDLHLFNASPFGYMANSPRSNQKSNVKIEWILLSNLCEIPILVATRDIKIGDEILCTYRNNESKQIRQEERLIARSSAVILTPVSQSDEGVEESSFLPSPSSPGSAPSLLSLPMDASEFVSLSEDFNMLEDEFDLEPGVFGSEVLDPSYSEASDSSLKSSSESEPEPDENASSRTNARIVAAPRRTLSLSFRKPIKAKFELLEGGVADVRKVWKEYLPKLYVRHKLKKQGSSADILLESDFNTQREKRFIASLSTQWSSINECCHNDDRIETHGICLAFRTCASLLRARLEFAKSFDFDRVLISVCVRVALNTALSNKFVRFSEYSLCHACYANALGLSRSTIYRIVSRPEGLEPTIKSHTLARTTRMVAQELAIMAHTDGQSSPMGENTFAGTENRVLPFTTKDMCRVELESRLSVRDGHPVVISASTFDRAIIYLREHQKITINIHKSKQLARCAQCEELTGHLYAARKTGDATLINQYERFWNAHTAEWKEQRYLFEEKKLWALRAPWEVCVLTLDGMDTAKTNLPHYKRKSKHAACENTLNIRVVGGFYFGGVVPCLGLTSFEDIPSKGGSASITAIEAMIDTQWLAMDPTNIAPIPKIGTVDQVLDPSAPVVPSCSPSAISAESDDESEHSDAASEAILTEQEKDAFKKWRNVHQQAPSDAPKKKVPFMWPEGLHLTFDNTASDCKNTATFKFLGALVAIGVFRWITVSTLLVGHTHDIVDQMFSVWSGLLKRNDAPTIEKMHALFRKKYSTKIYELDRLVKATSKNPNHRVGAPVAERLVELANDVGVAPHLIHQTFCVNAHNWCHTSKSTIQKIGDPHVFYIVSENVPVDSAQPGGAKHDVVFMYSRFLSRSTEDTSVHHRAELQNVRFGPWTSRMTLLLPNEVPRNDPLRVPPQPIRTDGVLLCLKQHAQELNISQADYNSFWLRLKNFETASNSLKAKCPECDRLLTAIHKIGTISRKEGASAEALAFANGQTKEKIDIRAQLQAHLKNTGSNEKHDTIQLGGWWTKWLERVEQTILPYYVSRKLIAAPTAEQLAISGRSRHPIDLPRDKYDPPIVRTRVDQEWKAKHKQPEVDDIIIARGNAAHSPFWLGRILHPIKSKQVEQEPVAIDIDIDMDHGATAVAASGAAAAATAKTTRSTRKRGHLSYAEHEEEDNDHEEDKEFVPDSDFNDERKTAPAAAAASTSKRSSKRKRGNQTASSASNSNNTNSNSNSNGISTSQQGKEQKTSRLAASATAGAAAAVATTSAPTLNHDQDQDIDLAAAAAATSTDSSNVAAAAAATAAAFAPRASHIRTSDRHSGAAAAASEGQTQAWKVKWYTFVETPVVKLLQLDNMKQWDKVMDEVGGEELTKWNNAKKAFKSGQFARVPFAVPKRWENVTYTLDPQTNPSTVDSSALIVWGKMSEIFTSTKKLKTNIFNKVAEDICEKQDLQHNMAVDHEANAAATA